jgi:hypothetical protein
LEAQADIQTLENLINKKKETTDRPILRNILTGYELHFYVVGMNNKYDMQTKCLAIFIDGYYWLYCTNGLNFE